MLTIGGMLSGAFGGGAIGISNQTSQSSQSILNHQHAIAALKASYAQNTQKQRSSLAVGDVVHVPDEGFKVLEMLEYVQDNTPYLNYSAPYTGATTTTGITTGGYYNPYAQHQTASQTLVTTSTDTAVSIWPSSSAGSIVFANPSQNTYTTYQYANWSNLEIPEEDGEWFELVSQKEAHNADVGVMISLKSGRLIENVYLGGLTKDKFMTEVKEAVKEDK